MKTAIVVGAGQSLGAFLAKGLATAGYNVVVADINTESAIKVSDEINLELPGQALPVYINATNESDVAEAFKIASKHFGSVDLLVYNAGVAKASKITEFTLEDFNFNVNVNLNGYFLCAREAARHMVTQGVGGRIIQINSKSGKVGSKFNSGYSAAKFGTVGLTQSLALDLADDAITVNSLMLGNQIGRAHV